MLPPTADSLDEALLTRLMTELESEAALRRFEVAPNPCVGAAVLSGGKVVSRGHTAPWGGDHAEVDALKAAVASGTPPKDWDLLLVTLEPCSSTGKTPPCVDAILDSGIPRVVVGELDPDSRHQGAGLERLRNAGVEVYLQDGHASLAKSSPHFLAFNKVERLRRPRPWTIAKWAQTRTGQLEPPEDVGEGRWISCEQSRLEVHQLRSRVDAIVTGSRTVQLDNPRLSIRPPVMASKGPLRVVIDSVLRTSPTSQLFHELREGEVAGDVLILTLAGADASRWRALQAAGAEIHGLHTEDGSHVSLREVQSYLWERGVRRLLVETGPDLLQAYLDCGFVDQVRIYTGDVNGGRGKSMGEWLSRAKLESRIDRELGDDAVLEGFLGE